jgi:RNase P/RNase MRP subunit p29
MNQVPRPATQPLPPPHLKAPSVSARSTRTIPVVHGVILRPPTRPATGRLTIPSSPNEPMKNIEQLMAEADPVKTLSQTGSIRMLKRLSPEAPALRPPGTPPPIRAENLAPPTPAPPPVPPPLADTPVIEPAKAVATPSPWPSFQAKSSAPGIEVRQPDAIPVFQIKKAEPLPPLEIKKAETPASAATSPVAVQLQQPRSGIMESTFMSRPGAAAATTPSAVNRPPPPALPPMIAIGSVAKRKAKLADVARIILPPKREETGPLPQAPAPSATVVPPAFPVPSMTTQIGRVPLPKLVLPQAHTHPVSDSPFMERASTKPSSPVSATPTPEVAPAVIEAKEMAPTVDKPPVESASVPAEGKPAEPETPKAPEAASVQPQLPLDAFVAGTKSDTPAPVETPKPELATAPPPQPTFDFVPKTDFEAPKLDPSLVFDPATMPAKPLPAAPTPPESLPQIDTESHKAEPEVLPKLDPEAHKPLPEQKPTSTEIAPAPHPDTREFHLTNGERVAGVVLSETPDTIYVEHATLGVLTIPRGEIATRLVEIILINGDRIVGNIMAETADMLYVRHSSLGMLSVPRAQRSTRVVEAILKNGDRILGEVLTETETFTVIKSATLGTVTIPHDKLNMLNRKIEQIEMKALPSTSAQLPDKRS